MITPAEVLVFLHSALKDVEADIATIQEQREVNAQADADLMEQQRTARMELSALQSIIPLIKGMNDHGTRTGYRY